MAKTNEFVQALKDGLEAVETISRTVDKFNLPVIGQVSQLATTLAAIGTNVLTRVGESEQVMNSTDKNEVRATIKKLQQQNDALNRKIIGG